MEHSKQPLLTHRWFQTFYLIFIPVLLSPFIGGAFLFFMARKVDVPAILYGAFAFSLVLAYCALAVYVNKSDVFIEDNAILVRCGPLPWPNKRLPMDENAHFKGSTFKQGTSSSHHSLLLVNPNGQTKRVISGISLEQVEGWAEELNQKFSPC